jgi:hypothetical protein
MTKNQLIHVTTEAAPFFIFFPAIYAPTSSIQVQEEAPVAWCSLRHPTNLSMEHIVHKRTNGEEPRFVKFGHILN